MFLVFKAAQCCGIIIESDHFMMVDMSPWLDGVKSGSICICTQCIDIAGIPIPNNSYPPPPTPSLPLALSLCPTALLANI